MTDSPFRLAGRSHHPSDTTIVIGDLHIGSPAFVLAAGPCAVESREQTLSVARRIRETGARILRGGAYKPRTSPYSFQGLGREGLEILKEARAETGLRILTEVLSPSEVEEVALVADILQIGARNMQNFPLLDACGRQKRPVLLKRGLSATIEEWLCSAEYILSRGNPHVILCERGIRTFEPMTRNTLDLSSVPILKSLSHLPVLVDPSHATGRRDCVAPLAKAALAAGADGVLIEVHPAPDSALCDGAQSLPPEAFDRLAADLARLAPAFGRHVP